MNEMPVGGRREPSSTRPGRPAVRGEMRRRLQRVFPDLDPDVVSEVLGLTGPSHPNEQGPKGQGEK